MKKTFIVKNFARYSKKKKISKYAKLLKYNAIVALLLLFKLIVVINL